MKPHRYSKSGDVVLSLSDGVLTYYKPLDQPVYVVEPARTPPRGVMVFVHGLCEHPLRFLHLGRHWAQLGIQTVLFSLEAHGHPPEDFRKLRAVAEAYAQIEEPRALAERLESLDATTQSVAEQVRARNLRHMPAVRMSDHVDQVREALFQLEIEPETSLPLWLGGHSLGGLIACESAYQIGVEGRVRPRGVLLFSPGLRPIGRPGVENAMVKLGWAMRGLIGPDSLLTRMVSTCRPWEDVRWSSRFVSDLEDEIHLHEVDPLNLKQVAIRYLAAIQSQMSITGRRGGDYPCDVQIHAATDDRIVSTEGSRSFAADLGRSRNGSQPVLTLYDSFFAHDLTRSSRAAGVLASVDAWLGSALV